MDNRRLLITFIGAGFLGSCSLAPEMKDVLDHIPDHFKEAHGPTVESSDANKPDMAHPDVAPKENTQDVSPAENDSPAPDSTDWKIAEPSDQKDRGEWWKIFADSALDNLETQAMAASPTLKAARERVNQARATAKAESAGLFPDISAMLNSNDQGNTNANFPGSAGGRQQARTVYNAKLTASYELDLFGKNF